MSEPTPSIPSSTVEYYAAAPVQVYAAREPRQIYWLHGLLLLATCFTTLVVGARMQYGFDHGQSLFAMSDDSLPFFPAGWVLAHPARLWLGAPFAASLMLILLAHEMGHYVYCLRYGVWATLPFFIPAPPPFGTMGAVIRIRSAIRSRAALFDIGIAGPIAGFVVAIAVLGISLGLSQPLPAGAGPGYLDLNYPLIFRLTQRALGLCGWGGRAAALPLRGLLLHPMAIAAWVGMLATSLNLLPGGQLDGGHIIFSLAPRVHKTVSRVTILILLPMAYFLWTGWLVWAVLLRLSSLRHPQVAEIPRVRGGRIWMAGLALGMLALTLTPAPIKGSSIQMVVSNLWPEVRDFAHHWLKR
jgi:Peptidase family M50